MKMKLCIVRSVSVGYDTVVEITEFLTHEYYIKGSRIPLTEVIEIDFPELPADKVTKGQVEIIDKQMTKVRADAEASITALEGKKQELLSISYVEE